MIYILTLQCLAVFIDGRCIYKGETAILQILFRLLEYRCFPLDSLVFNYAKFDNDRIELNRLCLTTALTVDENYVNSNILIR